jgi:hypothetical protein
MNFAEQNLRPVSCSLARKGNGLGIELEPFMLIVDGVESFQEEPEMLFDGFQLPTTDLELLAGKSFDIAAGPERCEGSIYLHISMMGEHYWVDLLAIEFGELDDQGLQTWVRVRFPDLYFADPASFEHTFVTRTRARE